MLLRRSQKIKATNRWFFIMALFFTGVCKASGGIHALAKLSKDDARFVAIGAIVHKIRAR